MLYTFGFPLGFHKRQPILSEIVDFHTLERFRYKRSSGICLKSRIVLHGWLGSIRRCIPIIFLWLFIGEGRHQWNRRFLNFWRFCMDIGCWNLLKVQDCHPWIVRMRQMLYTYGFPSFSQVMADIIRNRWFRQKRGFGICLKSKISPLWMTRKHQTV